MSATSRESTTTIHTRAKRIIWLPALVLVISVVGFGLLAAYSALNLRPDLSAVHTSESRVLIKWVILFGVIVPTIAAMIHVWPIARWLRAASPGELHGIDAAIAQRAANVPLALAAFSLIGWLLFTVATVVRVIVEPAMPFGLAVHFVARPLLVGMIAATAIFFSAEYIFQFYR